MNLIKRNIFIMSAAAAFGLLVFILGVYKSDYLRNMGLVMIVICSIKIANYAKLMKNKEEADKFANSQQDERTIFIARKSYSTVFWLTLYLEFLVSCYFSFAGNTETASIISYVVCAQLLL